MPITNSVGAGRSAPNELNTSLKAGITKIMMMVTTMKATTMTEIGYISADLILDLMASVFHVRGQAVQQGFQDTGRFARLHQIAVEAIEVHGVLAIGRVQRGAGLHVGANIGQKARHAGVGVAPSDNVEGLKQRDARLHHRCHLAGEQRNVLGLDPLAPACAALLDLAGQHALAA